MDFHQPWSKDSVGLEGALISIGVMYPKSKVTDIVVNMAFWDSNFGLEC